MPANEPLMGLPYPLSSDSDDVPRDIKALADAAALKMNMMPRTFATTAARDAFYTANPTLKVAGIVAVIGSAFFANCRTASRIPRKVFEL